MENSQNEKVLLDYNGYIGLGGSGNGCRTCRGS